MYLIYRKIGGYAMKNIKICCVSSSGGHWVEMTSLNRIFKKYSCFFVTEEGPQVKEAKYDTIFCVDKISRKDKDFIVNFIKLWMDALRIIRQEKPNVIFSTGALVSVPFCYVGKLLGCKVIYIESFARVENRSLTGRIVNRIADLFIVQWESMLKLYPKAVYGGKVF